MAWPELGYFSSIAIAITDVAAAALCPAQGRASAEPTGEVVSVSLSVFLSPATRGAGSDKPEYDTEYGKWEERSEFIVLRPSPAPSGWRDSRAAPQCNRVSGVSPTSRLMSPFVKSHDRRLGHHVEMQVEPDHRARAVRIHVEPLGLDGEDREQIAVRMVSRGRTGPAVARRPEVGACLQRAGRQVAAAASRTHRELRNIAGNVHHEPVPEARASGRVRIVERDGKAPGSRRRPRPPQMRRPVSACAAKSVIGRQNEIVGQIVAIFEAVAGEYERHDYDHP